MISRERLECIELADLCLRMGQPTLIIPFLIDGHTPAEARRLLELQATPPVATTPPPAAPSHPEPYAQSSFPSEELERAAAARFSAQGAQR